MKFACSLSGELMAFCEDLSLVFDETKKFLSTGFSSLVVQTFSQMSTVFFEQSLR